MLIPLLLVLLSCVLHAIWNLYFKQAQDKLAFTGLFLALTPVIYFPLFLLLVRQCHLPPQAWWCVAGTALAYAGYFAALARAYEGGELSVVYPLARGVGPVFTLLWAVLFLGERPSAAGLLGIGLIVGGTIILHWPGQLEGPVWKALASPSSAAAVVVGIMYSIYSLIDKIGVGRLHVRPELYIYLTYTAAAVLVTPWTIRRRGLAALRREWELNASRCVAVAILNLLAYLLVLRALAFSNAPVSYIVPLRTCSVLVGVLLGVEVLKESAAPKKLGAALLMMSGVALIAWRG